MKKKKVKALIRERGLVWGADGKVGPPGPVGERGKDLSKEVGELYERVRRIEEVLQGQLVKKFLKVQDSSKQ